MPSNQFLDDLCNQGYASKKDIKVKSSQPSYPYKAFQAKGSHYFSTVTQYTIEFGVAKNDKTTLIVPTLRSMPRPQKESESQISILEKIIAWLENFGRQRGGIPFTSEWGGAGPEYHAEHPDNPVNIDALLAVAGVFAPSPWETDLKFPWLLEYLRELATELKQNEAESKAKENRILSNTNDPSRFEKFLDAKAESEIKEQEIIKHGLKEFENITNNAKSVKSNLPNLNDESKNDIDSMDLVRLIIPIGIKNEMKWGYGWSGSETYLDTTVYKRDMDSIINVNVHPIKAIKSTWHMTKKEVRENVQRLPAK